jgi:ABC-2 type transport system ATP-binding protein
MHKYIVSATLRCAEISALPPIQNILILLSTAYMDEAERCGKVHLFNEGQVLTSGEPREILTREGVRSFDELFQKREGVTL